MKFFKSLLLCSSLLVLSATIAHAQQDSISLGVPGYGGSGCPNGSASVTLSPDGKSLTLIFDQFVVESGGMTGKRLDRKNCDIAIPVHVPQGMSVSVIGVDYRGFNSLPRGASSRFSAEYFFAGARGPQFLKTFMGPLNEDFTFTNKLGLQSLVWSPCGADVNLRVNASMMNQTNRLMEDTMSTIDSADFQSAIIYQLQWQSCR